MLNIFPAEDVDSRLQGYGPLPQPVFSVCYCSGCDGVSEFAVIGMLFQLCVVIIWSICIVCIIIGCDML